MSRALAPELAARYQLGEELGRGGMGVVHRAVQLALDRPVALKLLTGDLSVEDGARFQAEAQLAARLAHPALFRARAHLIQLEALPDR